MTYSTINFWEKPNSKLRFDPRAASALGRFVADQARSRNLPLLRFLDQLLSKQLAETYSSESIRVNPSTTRSSSFQVTVDDPTLKREIACAIAREAAEKIAKNPKGKALPIMVSNFLDGMISKLPKKVPQPTKEELINKLREHAGCKTPEESFLLAYCLNPANPNMQWKKVGNRDRFDGVQTDPVTGTNTFKVIVYLTDRGFDFRILEANQEGKFNEPQGSTNQKKYSSDTISVVNPKSQLYKLLEEKRTQLAA